MRLVTRDSDGKPDTPLSIWIGAFFIGLAFFFESVNIGPGGFGMGPAFGDMGINLFFAITGLTVLIPGVMLTLVRKPEES
jgi:predicted phage tail protein